MPAPAVLCPGFCGATRPRAGAVLGGLLLATALAAPAAWAQRPATRPVPRKVVPKADTVRHQLSVRQTEEALRLLLRADSVQRARVPPGMEADAEGFVLDQTLTKAGREFYDLFYSTFQTTTGFRDYTIVLSERPLRGTSSLISMNVNDTELLETPLPTRTEQVEEVVAQAVEIARDYLTEQQAQSTQMETAYPPAKP